MLRELLTVLIAAFTLSFLMMPWFIKLASRFKLVDRPAQRKIHTQEIPTLGGVVIYLAFMAGIWMSLKLSPAFEWAYKEYLLSLFIGSSAILLLGILHDTIDIQAEAKLMGQVIVGLLLFINGIKIEAVTNPLGGQIYLSSGISMVLTVGWVVVVINAINLIDGLDGLAGGITVISSVALLFIAFLKRDISSMFLTISLIGSTLGFLRYNFYPAKIFMGDTGSMFLGFILSIISILGINKIATTVSLLVPITVLGIPIYDTILAVFRRLITRSNVLSSDRRHLHYRLLDMGLNPRQAVLFLYVVASYFGLVSWLMILISPEYAFLLLILLGLGVFGGIRSLGFIVRKIRTSPRP